MFVPSDHRLIIQFVRSHTPEDEWKGYLYAVVIFVVAVVQSICLNQYFIRVMVVGMRLRTAVMSIVYKKVGHGREGWMHTCGPTCYYVTLLLSMSYVCMYVLCMDIHTNNKPSLSRGFKFLY